MNAVYNEFLRPSLSFFLRSSNVISISGSGGKTSLLIALGNYFYNQGEKVLLTTTTHLGRDIDYGDADLFVELGERNRYKCPGEDKIKAKIKDYDRVLIEADGSRRLPLKYHTLRDPVVIDETTSTLSVVGLSALRMPIKDVLFGYEDYYADTKDSSEIVTLDTIERLITLEKGVRKDMKGSHSFIVLNQADTLSPNDVEKVNAMMFRLGLNYMLISLKENKLYSGVVF